jgi:hypothetical protein
MSDKRQYIESVAPKTGQPAVAPEGTKVETVSSRPASDVQKRDNAGVTVVGGGNPTANQKGVTVVKRS